jgi:hypothetical protein
MSHSLFRGDDSSPVSITDSSIAPTSVYTFASSSIPPGIGSLSGKRMLRGVEAIVITRRVAYIEWVLFTFNAIPDEDRVYDELLELVRCVVD